MGSEGLGMDVQYHSPNKFARIALGVSLGNFVPTQPPKTQNKTLS
jgi:hypothetical protein